MVSQSDLLSAAFDAVFNPRPLTSDERAHHLHIVQAPRAHGQLSMIGTGLQAGQAEPSRLRADHPFSDGGDGNEERRF